MILLPIVNVQCDQLTNGAPCRRSQVIILPSFQFTSEALGAFFLAQHPAWHIGPTSKRVFCPECKARALVAQKGGG